MKRKKIFWSILAAMVLIFVIVMSVSGTIEQMEKNKYWDKMRTSFMVTCTEGEEVNYDYCNCVFNYLQNRLTLEEMLELGFDVAAVNEAGNTNYPTIIFEAAEVCYE